MAGKVARETAEDPFLFIGHGFGTSARALECYLWFSRPPGARAREQIVARLPFPVSSFGRFDGELLHFGSDDRLEARVSAAYHPAYRDRDPSEALDDAAGAHPEPRRREWKAFCQDFERVVRAIDARNRLVAVIKPDDGTYGRTPSPWHRRSRRRAGELAALAVRRAAQPRGAWSAMAMNLLEDVLPKAAAAKDLPADARGTWLTWLDQLIAAGDRPLREAFIERAAWVLASIPSRRRDEVVATLKPATRRAVEAATERLDAADPRPAKTRSPKRDRPKAGRDGTPAFKAALTKIVVPRLRELEFEGALPRFRRLTKKRSHLVWFEFSTGYLANVGIGLAALTPHAGATIKQDWDRAFEIRNQHRKTRLADLVSADARALYWYEDAEKKWGPDWADRLARAILDQLDTKGLRWLARK